MKRRDAIKLLPLSMSGLAGLPRTVFSQKIHEKNIPETNNLPLAIQYTKKVCERLKWIRENQSENLLEASYAIARTIQNGGRCWAFWDAGHTTSDLMPGRNGEPEIFTWGNKWTSSNDGDLLLARTYRSESMYEEIKRKNIFLIGGPGPSSGDAKMPEYLVEEARKYQMRSYADIWIETNATSFGGVIFIPGMPAPIGPITGVVGPVTLWMMIADACRILARRGISLPVKGDEPKVTGEKIDNKSFSGWVSLNDPLMDDYYNEVIRQIELIGAELGTIRKIAKMCVDTHLNGGTVYCYSRYSSIAGEANTRRSGLSLTTGIYGNSFKGPFKGTKNDCVILGIIKPDDEVDLTFLDMFKKKGLRTASLGPMTRNIDVPDGRTVPKETEFHAGRMCDTYGIFSVPGFEQKICPTSGVILNQLFWATMMEVVEQFMERTGGDVPGIFFSWAIKGGRPHMHRLNALNKAGVKGY